MNSKYIHTPLAAWYLKANCESECNEISILDFTINDNIDVILAAAYKEKGDLYAFSCYIWNIDCVMSIAKSLKKILPGIKIVLGGPEVSYDSKDIMKEHNFIDFIIKGEGEVALAKLIESKLEEIDYYKSVEGLIYKEGNEVLGDESFNLIKDLNLLETPYTNEILMNMKNRIIYYESSRGCPFSCSYCISSTFDGVRYFSFDRVKEDLLKIMSYDIRQIKFVDRTFNCNKDRAKKIFKFIIENKKDINFHFEVAADLFDDEMIQILSQAPSGLIQFEIGIQTTNVKTLESIDRKTDINKVFKNIKKISSLGNIHLHLDLIAGLPYESYNSFVKSYNDVYNFLPNQLQLGFLKMLKGSKIRREREGFGYKFRDYAPYEILENNFLSYEELQELKGIEDILDKYYNKGKFNKTINYVIKNFFSSPFDFYKRFYLFNLKNGFYNKKIAGRELYDILYKFLSEVLPSEILLYANELLKFDFLSTDNTRNLPSCIHREYEPSLKMKSFEFLKETRNIKKFLPGFWGIPAKSVFKSVHFEIFKYDVNKEAEAQVHMGKNVVLFNYTSKNKVTGTYEYKILGEFIEIGERN